jgi:hypothetical protein
MSDHEPLSWLLLERYALGEVSAEERTLVEARLAVSAEDRACLAAIRADDSELPSLPTLSSADRPKPVVSARKKRSPLFALSAVMAVAAALFMMFRPHDLQQAVHERGDTRVKGGDDIALTLVSDSQPGSPRTFSPGERFKLLVSCPPTLRVPLLPLVFQAGQRFEPLPRAETFACGNREPWPGAFTLDGKAPALVCIAFTQAAMHARTAKELGSGAVCATLEPVHAAP